MVQTMRVSDQIGTFRNITGYFKFTTGYSDIPTGYLKIFTGYFQIFTGYSKFDHVLDGSHSLPDGIMRATDVKIGGTRALVCGYGDVGQCSRFDRRSDGARILTSERDPICALQACADGFQVVKIVRVIDQVGIFGIIGNFKIITMEHSAASAPAY